MSTTSSEVRLPAGFDPTNASHCRQLERYVMEKAGPAWRISRLDPKRGVALLSSTANFTSVTDEGSEKKTVSLEEGTKESDGARVAASMAERYPGFHMTSFEPYLLRAQLTRLDETTARARAAIATALSVKPWKVSIGKRPDGGYSIGLPDSYMPGRHYEKLDEVAKEVVGGAGWYVKVDSQALTAAMIPSDPPTFPGTIPYPMTKKDRTFDFNVGFGVKLPEPGSTTPTPFSLDLTDSMFQLGGLAGSGKDLRVDELVPTVDGFKTVDELTTADRVFTPDGSLTDILGFSERHRDVQTYRVTFDDGTETITGPGHQWKASTSRTRAAHTRTGAVVSAGRREKHLAKAAGYRRTRDGVAPGVCATLSDVSLLAGEADPGRAQAMGVPQEMGNDAYIDAGAKTHQHDVLHFNDLDLPVTLSGRTFDEQIVGLRAWATVPEIADHIARRLHSRPATRQETRHVAQLLAAHSVPTRTGGAHGVRARVFPVDEVLDFMADRAEQMAEGSDARGHAQPLETLTDTATMLTSLDKGWAVRLTAPLDLPEADLPDDPYQVGVGLLRATHVPTAYLRASIDQRLSLLQGLMDSHGTISAGGTSQVTVPSGSLADDVLELVRSLGIKATRSQAEAGHRITFTTSRRVFTLPGLVDRLPEEDDPAGQWKHVRSIEPVAGRARTRCVKVAHPSHMFLVGSGFTPTHNSVTLNSLITSALANGFELAIADTEDKAVDFEWCKDFVRPLGWGCNGLPSTVGMLGNLYEEGKRRAGVIKRHGVKKLAELPTAVFDQHRPILIIVDEVTGLFAKEVVPKSLPKDHPMRVEAEEKNVAVDMIKSYINKIAAEQRFVGARLALSTQVASRDTGIDTKLRTNLHHKAQPLSSLLPVPVSEKFPNGWATIGELEVGDQVVAPDGSLPEVSGLTPIRRGDVYRMTFDDGQAVDSDAGHQWIVSTHYSRSAQGAGRIAKRGERPLLKVATTEEIAQKVKLRTASDKPINNYAIPLTAAVHFPEADLPLDPYILGAWLGDGTTGSGEIASSRARSCTDEQGVTDQEYMIGHLRDFRPKPKPSSPASVISTTGLKAQLRVAGVLTDKHIPAIYLRSSIRQRLALLQGLMDTDGWVSSDRGYCAYVTTSEKLRNGVVELIRSLGIKATIGESESYYTSTDEHGVTAPIYTGSTAYRIQFRTTVPVFRLPRKLRSLPDSDVPGSSLAHFITSVEKIGVDEVRCIEVDHPDHLYLTDGFITTHNCLQGTNPTEANKRLIFPNPDVVPNVPANVAEDPVASRGVGLAQPEGAAPTVYKAYYADTDALYDYLVGIGVPRHTGQDPTTAVIDEYLPHLGDDDDRPSQLVKNRKAMEAEAMTDPETGERMSGFEYANLQRSRSVRKSVADELSGEG